MDFENCPKNIERPISENPCNAGCNLSNKISPESFHILRLITSFLSKNVEAVPRLQISDLPQEILIKIFAYFSEKELISIISPVCRRWRLLSRSPFLWKSLEFYGTTESVICRILSWSPELESVSLNRISEVCPIIRQMSRCNKNLKRIRIRYCTYSGKEEKVPESVLRNLVVCCRHIEEIDLKGTQFSGYCFYQDLARLQNLKSVNVGQNIYVRVDDLLSLAFNCHGLKELKMFQKKFRGGENKLSDSDAVFLFGYLKDSLTSLEFDTIGLGTETFQAILECSKIESLALNNTFQMNSDVFRIIPQQLRNLHTLKIMFAGQLKNEDFHEFFIKNYYYLQNIRCLDFHSCWTLGDAGIKAAIDTCGSKLESLSISCCKSISNEGVKYIITTSNMLKYLNVAYVIKMEPTCLAHIPLYMTQLEKLVVDNDPSKTPILVLIYKTVKNLDVFCSLSQYTKKFVKFP